MLRIASVPSDHVYVRHLDAPGVCPQVVRLADPVASGAIPGTWSPSPVLEPSWLRDHADAFDVVHVHFGFEHRTPGELTDFVTTLRSLGAPLVLTVHDLSNPHLVDQARHDAALDVLVPAAETVITLTEGAAATITERWGCPVVVLPHPHVVDLDRLAQPRPVRTGFVVGLHDKARANNDPEAVRPTLAHVVDQLPGGRLHPGHRHRLSDDELWDHLSSLDVLVLAYRHGTHSGFVEACADLGTIVVAPLVGHLADQQRLLTYDLDDPSSLAAAVCRAHEERPTWRVSRAARVAQRFTLADAHAALYRTAGRPRVAA